MSGTQRNAIVIAITGGIACGKSEVGRILERMGFEVCDTDRVAHELMASGTTVFQCIVDSFGKQILTQRGEISREKLGKIVFENSRQRLLLNRLVHPAVRQVMEDWISMRRRSGENAAAQIPLLFESGMNDMDWDGIVCVSSPEEQVAERLAKRGLSREEARVRIESQMELSRKEQLSDRVIHNLGTLHELEAATEKAVESLLAER